MNGGPATQTPGSTRQPRSGGWRATLTDPLVAAIGLYSIVAMLAAIAAYFTVFTVWAGYDDEGTLLVTLQSFAHGGTLYSDIYTIYGPFYYELFGGFFSLFGADVTTDASRTIVIVLWVGTSLCFGLATQRITGRLLLGVSGMIAAFSTLYVLANEPMHPQVLCVALLGLFALLAAGGPSRRPLWLGTAAGALIAALVMTKINLGAYALAAVAVGAVLTAEPLRRRRWICWPVLAAAILLPLYIGERDLSTGWVREFVVVQALAMTALVVAAWPLAPPLGERDETVPRWLLGALAGFVVAFVAILVAILLAGSPLPDVYEGMVTEALRVRDVNMSEFPMSIAVVDWAVVAVAGAAVSLRLRAGRGGSPSVWPGVLRVVAGLAIWLTIARITPVSIGPSVGNQDSLPLILAWIAAIPPAGVEEPPYKRFLRVMLPALGIAEVLQVYPVAGSQVGIASLTFVPVGALCLADGLASLKAWSAARGSLALERYGAVVAVSLVALAGIFAIHSILRSIADNAKNYGDAIALPFPGATQLHLQPEDYENYTRLVADLHRYGCTDFIGYPNVNSLYLWSGIEPPPPDAPGAWIKAMDDERQQRVVDELRASPRPCAIRNDGLAAPWLGSSPVPVEDPLVKYIFNDFHTVDQVNDFQFQLPNRGRGS
ncbi:MAG TPA: hypothetical protein VFG79_20270 [Solirubrobacter sp.]|nr:hypothetical protein [Solirubrobacter sp.]